MKINCNLKWTVGGKHCSEIKTTQEKYPTFAHTCTYPVQSSFVRMLLRVLSVQGRWQKIVMEIWSQERAPDLIATPSGNPRLKTEKTVKGSGSPWPDVKLWCLQIDWRDWNLLTKSKVSTLHEVNRALTEVTLCELSGGIQWPNACFSMAGRCQFIHCMGPPSPTLYSQPGSSFLRQGTVNQHDTMQPAIYI